MRVLIDSPPPWAPSGYGLQAAFLGRALKELGHKVAISAFGGCHEKQTWKGIPILPCGTRTFSNGVVAGNYRLWKADLLILLGDLWVMEPEQFQGLNFMPWLPVDCTPLSVMDKDRLDRLKGPKLHPVAMSEFGARVLETAGHPAPVLPHCTTFKPDPAAGAAWRRQQRIPPDLFLISKVGVNNMDDRKAFSVTLQAFAEFARGRDDVGLYLHTEAQAHKSPNLAYMAMNLGIAGKGGSKVVFADEHRRAVDGYDQAWMHGLYNAASVLDSVTKAEGFCCPAIDALACGTPIIGGDNSAVREKLVDGAGWIVGGQPEWASHHHAWWQTPYVGALTIAYEKAYEQTAIDMHGSRCLTIDRQRVSAQTGARWSYHAMKTKLAEILAGLD
jgi:glycosyltransferase involved in cell wall biosynthesis